MSPNPHPLAATLAAIVRDVCELDVPSEHPDNVTVRVSDLSAIVERHLATLLRAGGGEARPVAWAVRRKDRGEWVAIGRDRDFLHREWTECAPIRYELLPLYGPKNLEVDGPKKLGDSSPPACAEVLGEAHDFLRSFANDIDDQQAWTMEARGAEARRIQAKIAALLSRPGVGA